MMIKCKKCREKYDNDIWEYCPFCWWNDKLVDISGWKR